jgi:hypothetical protein
MERAGRARGFQEEAGRKVEASNCGRLGAEEAEKNRLRGEGRKNRSHRKYSKR